MSKEAVAAKIDEMMKEERIRVFVPDNEYIWLSAEIISEIEPGKYEIEITDPDYKVKTHKHQVVNERIQVISMNELCIPLDALPLDNEGLTEDGVDDMTSLNYLHEPSILDNLRRRFHKYLPYTYTGEICIAVSCANSSLTYC
jgi:myosin-5